MQLATLQQLQPACALCNATIPPHQLPPGMTPTFPMHRPLPTTHLWNTSPCPPRTLLFPCILAPSHSAVTSSYPPLPCGGVQEWLNEKVHRVGSLPASGDELMEAVTGAPLQPQIFLGYLKAKYGALYHLPWSPPVAPLKGAQVFNPPVLARTSFVAPAEP